MHTKKFFAREAAFILAISVATLSLPEAQAHGDWPPKHGGLMNNGSETSFELVARGRRATLHVSDHGTPVQTDGCRGTLTITRGTATFFSPIEPAGKDRLKTALPVLLQRGDAVLARVTMNNGSIAAGRFAIK